MAALRIAIGSLGLGSAAQRVLRLATLLLLVKSQGLLADRQDILQHQVLSRDSPASPLSI